jgi:hypothetical protein
MEELGRYREWLRARGIENPTEHQVQHFKKKTRTSLRGALLEFLTYIWMDSEREYSGTRRWLRLQGLQNPSQEDLNYFTKKIRKTVVWRGSVLVALIASWCGLFWFWGVQLRGLQAFVPITWAVCGLTASFGRKLPEGDRAGARRLQWRR